MRENNQVQLWFGSETSRFRCAAPGDTSGGCRTCRRWVWLGAVGKSRHPWKSLSAPGSCLLSLLPGPQPCEQASTSICPRYHHHSTPPPFTPQQAKALRTWSRLAYLPQLFCQMCGHSNTKMTHWALPQNLSPVNSRLAEKVSRETEASTPHEKG